jgi:hypothetical protein
LYSHHPGAEVAKRTPVLAAKIPEWTHRPAASSWLNQVENWSAKIKREVIACGVFTSVKHLVHKLKRYIRHYNQAPKPNTRTYREPLQGICVDAIFTCYKPLVS